MIIKSMVRMIDNYNSIFSHIAILQSCIYVVIINTLKFYQIRGVIKNTVNEFL